MTDYPPFDENPECRCYPNGIAATICMTGHLTECHSPMTCDQAQCAHYQRALAAERNPEDCDDPPPSGTCSRCDSELVAGEVCPKSEDEYTASLPYPICDSPAGTHKPDCEVYA